MASLQQQQQVGGASAILGGARARRMLLAAAGDRAASTSTSSSSSAEARNVAAAALAAAQAAAEATDGDEEEAPAPDALPEAPDAAPTPGDLDVLNAMNRMRAKHGAPPLKWDARLKAGAEYYAGGCPLGHSGARGLGENMAWCVARRCRRRRQLMRGVVERGG